MNRPGPEPQKTGFAYQAAKASWATGAIIFVLIAFGGRTGARVIIELVALLLMLVGLLLGIIALFGIPKHGVKGILGPALTGIVINGLLVLIFATNFLAARAKARSHQSSVGSPAVVAVENAGVHWAHQM